jgi:glycosyltransferase involved in cell wall biosynthesis
MRIIQIGPYPIDERKILGGVQTSVYGLSKIQKREHQVFILDFPRKNIKIDEVELINGVTVYRFSSFKNKIQSVLLTKKYLRIVKKINPDICHIHGTMLNAFVLWLFLNRNYKTIVTIHGLAHIEKKNLWQKEHTFKNLFQYFYQSIVELCFISLCPEFVVDTPYVEKAISNYYLKKKIWKMPKCHVIPQGIDQSFFELIHKATTNRILSVGTLGKRKGHLYLIKAFSIVKEKNKDVEIVIAGGRSDESCYRQIESLIKQLGLKDSVNIIPNATNKVIQELYSNASIFALHSEEESQGIVFSEAMAIGLPIVATNVGGIPDVVLNGWNGILSNFGDEKVFARNILKLLEDKKLRMDMGVRNKKESKSYSWNVIADKIEKLYLSQ